MGLTSGRWASAIVSGRPRSDLERWFGETPGLWLVAEHGAFVRGDGAWVQMFSGSEAALADLHHKAHAACFIANSVNFPVGHEAEISVGAA